MLPDMIPGLTMTLSAPVRFRNALCVALIVPASSWNGADSSPDVGVIGAGSRAAVHASLSVSVPYAGTSFLLICLPKAE